MEGWIVFALIVAWILLRRLAVPEARMGGGILIMGAGIWLIYAVAAHPSHWSSVHSPDIVFPLLIGLWMIVKGALRFASY